MITARTRASRSKPQLSVKLTIDPRSPLISVVCGQVVVGPIPSCLRTGGCGSDTQLFADRWLWVRYPVVCGQVVVGLIPSCLLTGGCGSYTQLFADRWLWVRYPAVCGQVVVGPIRSCGKLSFRRFSALSSDAL